MLFILILFTAIFLGFSATAILYTLNSSHLDKQRNIINYQPYVLNQDIHVHRNNCYEIAIKCPLGSEDCRCTDKCGADFQATFILPDMHTIYNDQVLEEGLYCLPKQTIPCNKNLGHLIYANGKFICECKFPEIFAGPLCDTPQTCFNGILRSSLNNTIVDKFNITESDYYCSCDIPDVWGNSMIHLPSNSLECFVDFCKREVNGPISPQVTFNSKNGTCHCGDFQETRVKNMFEDDLTSPCTPCFIRELPETGETILNYKCASQNGDLSYAPPCKDFKSKIGCEPVTVKLKILDFKKFGKVVITNKYPVTWDHLV